MATETKSTVSCSSCRYWDAKGSDEGNCRRRAPQAVVFRIDEDLKFETRFPTTAATDWCGEFDPR